MAAPIILEPIKRGYGHTFGFYPRVAGETVAASLKYATEFLDAPPDTDPILADYTASASNDPKFGDIWLFTLTEAQTLNLDYDSGKTGIVDVRITRPAAQPVATKYALVPLNERVTK